MRGYKKPGLVYPHLQVGDAIRSEFDGYSTLDYRTACGIQIACTLTTQRLDLVRCRDCIEKAETDG